MGASGIQARKLMEAYKSGIWRLGDAQRIAGARPRRHVKALNASMTAAEKAKKAKWGR
jgi:hypothetical protein